MSNPILALNNTERICDSKQVRLLCGNPCHDAWSHYRSLLGVPPKVRKLTKREAYLLVVCADMSSNGYRNFGKFDVYRMAEKVIQELPKTKEAVEVISGSEPMPGSRLVEIISEGFLGRRLSKRSIYRKCNQGDRPGIPYFSTEATYSPEQVRRILKAVAA